MNLKNLIIEIEKSNPSGIIHISNHEFSGNYKIKNIEAISPKKDWPAIILNLEKINEPRFT